MEMKGHRRIRAALATLLRTIPGVGVVHEYERFSKNLKDFQVFYMVGQAVRGFYIKRKGYRESQHSSMFNRVRTRWVVQGYASLDDANASELAFDDVLDALAAKVRATPVLADAASPAFAATVTDEGAGLQLEDSGPVMFAGILCHGASFGLITEHLEEIEPDISDPTACDQELGETPCLHIAIDPVDVPAPAAEILTPLYKE